MGVSVNVGARLEGVANPGASTSPSKPTGKSKVASISPSLILVQHNFDLHQRATCAAQDLRKALFVTVSGESHEPPRFTSQAERHGRRKRVSLRARRSP